MNENLYTLICPNCGKTYRHIKKSMICPQCGNVAQLPILSDDQCDEILQADGSKALPKTNIEKRESKERLKDRAPENGGPVM